MLDCFFWTRRLDFRAGISDTFWNIITGASESEIKMPDMLRTVFWVLEWFLWRKNIRGGRESALIDVGSQLTARCDMGCLTAFFDKKNTDVPESKRCHPWHGSDCVLSVWKDLRAGNLWNKITDPFKSFSKFTGHSDNLYKQVRRQWDEMGGMRKPVEAQEGGKWLKRAKLKCLEAPKSCIKFTRHSKSL